MQPVSVPRILPPLSAKLALPDPVVPRGRTHAVDEVLKLNIEDKEESSPRKPSAKRGRPAEEQPAGGAASGELAPEGAGRPKRIYSQVCLDPCFSLFSLSFLAHTRVDRRILLSISWTISLRRRVQCPFLSQKARNRSPSKWPNACPILSIIYRLSEA